MAEPQHTSGWPALHPRLPRFTDPPITSRATWNLAAAPAPRAANAGADMCAEDRRRWAQDIDQAL